MKKYAPLLIIPFVLLAGCGKSPEPKKETQKPKVVEYKRDNEYKTNNSYKADIDTTFFGQLDPNDSRKGYILATGYQEKDKNDYYYKGFIDLKYHQRQKQRLELDFLPQDVVRFKLSGKPAIAVYGIKNYNELVTKKGCKGITKYLDIYLYENGRLENVFSSESDKYAIMNINKDMYLVSIEEKAPKEFYGTSGALGIRESIPPYVFIDILKWGNNRFASHTCSNPNYYYADVIDVEKDGRPELVNWRQNEFYILDIETLKRRTDLEGKLRYEKFKAEKTIKRLHRWYGHDKNIFTQKLGDYINEHKYFYAILRPMLEEDPYLNDILEKNAWEVNPEVMIKALYTEKMFDEIDPYGVRKMLPKLTGMDYVIGADGKKTKIWTPSKPYGWIRQGNGFAYIPRESRFENLDDKTIFRDKFGNPIVRSEQPDKPRRSSSSPFHLSQDQIQRARAINRQRQEQARKNLERARRDAERAMQNARKAAGSFLRQFRGKKKRR